MKKLFLTILCAFPLVGMERIKEVRASSKLGDIDLRHDDNGLYIMKDGEAQPIERHQCNKLLRELIASKKIKEFQEHGYISVNELDNEELIVRANVNGLKGAGPGGATAGFLVGKFVTYGVCHGALQVMSWFAGPAAPAIGTAAHLTAHPFIEAASNQVAIGCGIIGGILTGPA